MLSIQVDGAEYSLVFSSGATHQLERATHHIKDLLDKSGAESRVPVLVFDVRDLGDESMGLETNCDKGREFKASGRDLIQ